MATKHYWFFISILLITSCSSLKKSVLEVADQYHYHVGFYLYDPVAKKELININGSKYFTPASNTKVFTLYSANLVLPDSMPAFKYVKTDTAMYLWGLADPSFLNYKLPKETPILSLKKETPSIFQMTTLILNALGLAGLGTIIMMTILKKEVHSPFMVILSYLIWIALLVN